MAWLLLTTASAQQEAAPPESRAVLVEPELPDRGGLEFFALFQGRGHANTLASTNPLLDGQVIGRLGGTTGIVVDPSQTALYSEQRVNGFFTYAPPILNGDASLSAAFEIDWAFGDRAYGTGGNTGAGFGADQVNLQTRRLHADWFPSLPGHSVHVSLGLQFIGDGVNDPTAVGPDGLLRSGGKLMFFGSEAAGLSVYGRIHDDWGDRLRYRLGTYTLVEQGLSLPDDVWLSMADVQLHPAHATTVGVHGWYLQDRSGATGGALGLGPTSALYELQGGPRLDLYDGFPPPEGAPIDADLGWLGVDGGYNADLSLGPAGVHATSIVNVGRMYAPEVHDDDILGVMADVEGRVRYAAGEGSVLRLEGLYSSGDDPNPQRYSGVVTGNAYGIAGAVMPTQGTLLLFPDARAINRMVAVVSDVSGAGRGLIGVSGSAGYDPIPGRLTTTVGGATAQTATGVPWGTEINASVVGEPVLFCNIGLYAATVFVGEASGLPVNPWAVYAAVDWLVF